MSRYNLRNQGSIFITIGVFSLFLFGTNQAYPAVFNVDSSADTVDAVPGDSICADAGGIALCGQPSKKPTLRRRPTP